jgi:F0F1-type ATP synthase delta subunit
MSVAGNYAVALADLTQSTNSLDTTMSDIEKVEKVFFDPIMISFSWATPRSP